MVVDRAAGQQRGVEPAAVLVGTFQVEIGDRAAGMADPVGTTQHVPMGGAGVEPDVQGVVDLLVLRGLLAEQLGGVELEPGFDAFLLDSLRDLFHQLHGAWMQFATGLVQEERDRYAPVALARDAPVGTPGDHSVQARLAPARDEFGLGDGFQRSLAQGSTLPGLLVHADEPLRGGAIDQRRLCAASSACSCD